LPSRSARPLDLLYLEEDPELPPSNGDPHLPRALPPRSSLHCPDDMVEIRGEYCIDRYEATFVEVTSERELSPFYHPTRGQTAASYERYRRDRRDARNLPPLPEPAPFQLASDPAPKARSRANTIPQGYLNAALARAACEAAGKRLCTLAEWVTACRGQQNRRYPYGDVYMQGRCNVFRASHPAAVLHGNASHHHLDPRLNQVSDSEGVLLRRTGQTPGCRSDWGSDSVFDMVGNIDEWIDDGSFVGGFYARSTREGCDARIRSHAPEYFDYSLGTRCCRSLASLGAGPYPIYPPSQ
jgi:hypothetical protein